MKKLSRTNTGRGVRVEYGDESLGNRCARRVPTFWGYLKKLVDSELAVYSRWRHSHPTQAGFGNFVALAFLIYLKLIYL